MSIWSDVAGGVRRFFFGERKGAEQRGATGGQAGNYVHFGTDGITTVTERNVLAIDSVFACVDTISRSLAMMPIDLYRAESNGDKTAVRNHAAVFLLKRRPRRGQIAFEFRRALVVQAALWGNGYAYVRRDGAGSPVELVLVPAGRVQMVDTPMGLRYVMYLLSDSGLGNGETVVATPEDVIHIKSMSQNGIRGVDMVRLFGRMLGTALNINEYANSYFGNGAQVGGVVESPHDLGNEGLKKIREQFNEFKVGGSKAGHVAVLDEGMTYRPVGANMGDTAAIESDAAMVRKIARVWGVPSFMIGDMERATFDNVEHLSTLFINQTLMPWAQQIEEEFGRVLLTERQYASMNYEWKHDFEEYLRADTLGRAKQAEMLLRYGVISRNEARQRVGYASVAGLDDYLVPLNMLGGGEAVSDDDESDVKSETNGKGSGSGA